MSSLSCLFHLGSVIPSFSSVSSFFIFNIFLIHFALITLFLSFFSHPVSPICMFISLATVVISLTPTSPQDLPKLLWWRQKVPWSRTESQGRIFLFNTDPKYFSGDLVGYVLAWCSLLPIFLLVSFVTLILFRRDLHTVSTYGYVFIALIAVSVDKMKMTSRRNNRNK